MAHFIAWLALSADSGLALSPGPKQRLSWPSQHERCTSHWRASVVRAEADVSRSHTASRRRRRRSRQTEFGEPLPLERDLERLRRGQIIRDGVVQSIAFEGRKGAKMFVDVGAYTRVSKKAANGTSQIETRRVIGMLRLPRNASFLIEGTGRSDMVRAGPRLTKVCRMLRAARRDSRARVTCYVHAVRPESGQLVLTPYKPAPTIDESWRGICTLRVGDEVADGTIAKVGEKCCVVFAPVYNDYLPNRRYKKPCPAIVRRRSLPPDVHLETQLVKTVGAARILRAGQPLGRAWVRKIEPASARYELSLVPVDHHTLTAEKNEIAQRKRDIVRRKRRTAQLRVGDDVRGRVVRILVYGAVVDFGASATGIVLRNDTNIDDLLSWQGEEVLCRILDIQPRPNAPNAPRVSLERLDLYDDSYDEPQAEFPSPSKSESKNGNSLITQDVLADNGEVNDREDDGDYTYDEIEESLGLDTY